MLKRTIIALFLITLTFTANAEITTPKIVVINVQKIMVDSSAAKDAKNQLQAKRDKYQAEITAEEDKLKKAEEELVQQKNILTKEALGEKQKEFIKKINDVRGDVQEKKLKLDKAYKDALNEIQVAMTEVIEQMAQEQGFNIAIPTSQLVYAVGEMDITDEVLARLNKKLPKAKIKF